MSDTLSKTPGLAETRIAEPTGLLERINAAFLRGVLRTFSEPLSALPLELEPSVWSSARWSF
jgi:hypothetical protein